MRINTSEKIDLTKGINLQISGELGRYNTLPLDALVRIAESLQSLLITLAKIDLDNSDPIHLENFRMELSGFKKGSAVPQFILTPRIQTSIGNVDSQRKRVNKKFDKLMQLSNKGDFTQIKKLYPNPLSRNQIVDRLYDFTNSFGNAPTSIVRIENDIIKPVYKIKKLSPETKKLLFTEIISVAAEPKEEYGVAKVKVTTTAKGKIRNSIEQLYRKSETTLSYSPKVIVCGDAIYNLNIPLRCSLENENRYYLIQNELLDIIGTGMTEEEAEKNFSEEFNFIYRRYNELPDDRLSDKLRKIKSFLTYFVKSIEK